MARAKTNCSHFKRVQKNLIFLTSLDCTPSSWCLKFKLSCKSEFLSCKDVRHLGERTSKNMPTSSWMKFPWLIFEKRVKVVFFHTPKSQSYFLTWILPFTQNMDFEIFKISEKCSRSDVPSQWFWPFDSKFDFWLVRKSVGGLFDKGFSSYFWSLIWVTGRRK